MKRKILLVTLMVAMLLCVFAIVASAETPEMYIEFGARFPGSDEYITVYTQNAESSGNPRINFANYKFYSDVDFTQEVDISTVTGLDFSVAVSHGSKSTVNRMTRPSSAFTSCTEIKWFTTGFTAIDSNMFNGWTALSSFDFGCTTKIDYNAFQNTALVNLVIPSAINEINNSAFYGCTKLKTVVFEGGPKCTSSTFQACTALESVDFGSLTSICDNMFKGCTSLKRVELPSTVTSLAKSPFQDCTSLTYANLGQITSSNYSAFSGCKMLTEVVLPNTLTSVGTTMFQNCTALSYISLPNSLSTIGYGMFMGCTSLEYVELSNSAPVKDQMFSGCTSLKAISIPEGVTSVEARAFNGCTSLKAVYLPSTITSIGANAGWGYGAFNGCSNLYFVNEPFEVKDESGNWLGNSFVMPSEPAVYYMPQTLASINGGDFAYCEQINSCLVFPSTFTKISTDNGPFINNGKNNKKGGITVVFLGKMTEFCYSTQDGRSNNITFVFANPENTGIASLTKWYLPQTHKPSNCYAYFCAGKVSYDLSSFGPSSSGYTASETDFAKTTYTEQTQPHFQNPNGATSRDANCLDKASTFKTCFCGKEYDVVIDETSTALGHIYNLDSITAMVYADYTKDGVITCGCDREGCEGVKAETIKGSYLFTYNGYSRNSKGDMCVGYIVNAEYLECYKTLKQESFSFGLVSTVIDFDDEGVILDGEDKPLAPDYEGKVMSLDLTEKTGFSAYDMIITGFGEAYKDLFLAMNLYVIDGENTSYIWNNAESGTNAVVNYKQYSAIPA